VDLCKRAERGCESSSFQFELDGNFFIRSQLRDHYSVLFRAAGIGPRDAFVMSERREQSKKAARHRGTSDELKGNEWRHKDRGATKA
jgi:hypothetical protein